MNLFNLLKFFSFLCTFTPVDGVNIQFSSVPSRNYRHEIFRDGTDNFIDQANPVISGISFDKFQVVLRIDKGGDAQVATVWQPGPPDGGEQGRWPVAEAIGNY